MVIQAILRDQLALPEAHNSLNFGCGAAEFSTGYLKLAMDRKGPIRLFTVSLLLNMLKLFGSQPEDPSYQTNVFLSGNFDWTLQGMTLAEGRADAIQYRDVLIHIDEVPMLIKESPELFLRCVLLRNIIRSMGLPCLLSGTESTLLDVFDFHQGSRGEGNEPWVWLLTRFPVMDFSPQLMELTNRRGCQHCAHSHR